MIQVYAEHITKRLRYTLDVLFKDALQHSYQLHNDWDTFIHRSEPKISYGKNCEDEDVITIPAHPLLQQHHIEHQDPGIILMAKVKCLFPMPNFDWPFDVLAATFYMVSRYEEYLPHLSDEHGRLRAENCYAYQHNFLEKPVVNQWAKILKLAIQDLNPDYQWPDIKYRFTATYDVDSAYAYRQKGFIRQAGAFAKGLLNGRHDQLKERTEVLLGSKKDPFDNFDYMRALQQKHQFEAKYFFLLGDYAEYDKNIAHNVQCFQSLIKSIADYAEVGIHPSYASNEHIVVLKKELNRLKNITNTDVSASRQHFLKLQFPTTYRRLLDVGIRNDYTMGFASQPGFRAGIASSYFYYDLENEEKTPLRIHPFCVMDATFQYYWQAEIESAQEAIDRLVKEVKAVNGHFISLWHNNSLSDNEEWRVWRNLYSYLLEKAAS